MRNCRSLSCAGLVIAATACSVAADFASSVLAFEPAPGQYANTSLFNDPAQALGPPTGDGPSSPDNTGVVSLGGFGGSITLAFNARVLDDPANPMGLDAIVFGNAFYVGGDPAHKWAEPAHIEIALDANNNGFADDPWMVIPGSHMNLTSGRIAQLWDTDIADPTFPPALGSWIPPAMPALFESTAFQLDASLNATVLVNPTATTSEAVHGYADLSPTLPLGDLDGDGIVDDPQVDAGAYFTVPDDPMTIGITPGSGGGDAFDIAWAVDPTTGAPANLPGFDFIRITTAVHVIDPVFGEHSAEVDAVADVRPVNIADYDASGIVDSTDFFTFLAAFFEANADVDHDGATTSVDFFLFLEAFFGAGT